MPVGHEARATFSLFRNVLKDRHGSP